MARRAGAYINFSESESGYFFTLPSKENSCELQLQLQLQLHWSSWWWGTSSPASQRSSRSRGRYETIVGMHKHRTVVYVVWASVFLLCWSQDIFCSGRSLAQHKFGLFLLVTRVRSDDEWHTRSLLSPHASTRQARDKSPSRSRKLTFVNTSSLSHSCQFYIRSAFAFFSFSWFFSCTLLSCL